MDKHQREAQRPVNKEAVRMLVQDVGYQVASQKTGIKEPTLRQWAKRGHWNKPRQHSQAIVTTVTSPADAQLQILSEDNRETKLGLSQYARKQAKYLSENGKLKDHKAFKDITSGSVQIHEWQGKQETGINLNILSIGGDMAVQVKQD